MRDALGYTPELTVATHVSNLRESIEWYTTVLGFELAYEVAEIGWAEMKTSLPGAFIGLSQVERPKTDGGPTLTFGVGDIDIAKSRLAEHAVRFDGEIIEIPNMVRLLGFFDPDGNKYMLAQSLAPAQL